jgi:3-oxoacyl-[acyl-carrier protein] reductase
MTSSESTTPGRLAGRTALVTGAGRGIGRVVAERLAAEGAELMLTARTEGGLRQTAERIVAAAHHAPHLIAADLADDAAIASLVEAVRGRFSQLDILVNNAGVTHSAAFKDTPTAAWDRCMAVNARAPFILCRELLGLLEQAPAGRIIQIASVVGVKGYAGQSAYTASKHAFRGLSMVLAEELRHTPVRVHVLCPGGVATEMVTRVRPDIPAADLIDPREIADLVMYLVTHEGNAVMDELHLRRRGAAPWF